MTDYRLRNHDLLYADGERRSLGLRELAIFGSIVVTVTFGVVGYLADRFNAAGSGFNPSVPEIVAQQKTMPMSAAQLGEPRSSRFGS